MRVILFNDRFAVKVRNGSKKQTIRKTARCKPGDKISLRRWTGEPYRSKQEILREAVVSRVMVVGISHFDIFVDGYRFHAQHMAVQDGFEDWDEMRDWFDDTHGLPFVGSLIEWSDVKPMTDARRVTCCNAEHEIIQWTDAGPRQYGAECSVCGRRIAEETPDKLVAAFKEAGNK